MALGGQRPVGGRTRNADRAKSENERLRAIQSSKVKKLLTEFFALIYTLKML